MLKKIIKTIIPTKLADQLANLKNLSTGGYAQYKTIVTASSIDRHGDEIPWYTYPAIEYLGNLDFTKKNIFEFGSGNSSCYWAKRSAKIISVEHDQHWYKKLKLKLRQNQTLLYKPVSEAYENSISQFKTKFDVVIIDGQRRTECAKAIENHVNIESTEGFLVILDNADWYKEAAQHLKRQLNLIEVDFHGFGPINGYTWTTSLFFSRNFNFKAINDIQPYTSIAGIRQVGK